MATLAFPNAATAALSSIAVQPDGKVVAVGTRQATTSVTAPFEWTVARFGQDGQLDSSFAAGGVGTYTTAPLGGAAQDVQVLPGGKLLLAGDTGTSTGDVCTVLRLLPNGNLDAGFAPAAPSLLSVVDLTVHRVTVAVEPGGKAVLGGCQSAGGSVQPALIRYNTDGSQDKTFGTTDASGVTLAAVPDTEGKIVVGLNTLSRVNP